jgi:invasion protein IalB
LNAVGGLAIAQDAAKVGNKDAAAAATPPTPPPPAGWTVRCDNPTGAAEGGLVCGMEQAVYAAGSGQAIVKAMVQIDPEVKAPALIVQLPLGILLPEGLTLSIDDGKALRAPLQTCDGQGCYANVPVAAEMLDALGKGKDIVIAFQTVKKQPISVPVPLAGFMPAFQKIQ